MSSFNYRRVNLPVSVMKVTRSLEACACTKAKAPIDASANFRPV